MKPTTQFTAGAICELEAHFQFLRERLNHWHGFKAQNPELYAELVRHVMQIEERRKRYPKTKVPRKVAEIIRKRS